MRRIKIAFIIFIALFFVNSRALALDICVIGSDYSIEPVKDYLQSTGFFNSIAAYNAWFDTPGVSYLNGFDSVLVWSNTSFLDRVTLGNNLADYVDAGGGVVLATGVFYDSSFALQGRIMNDTSYSPYALGPINYIDVSLGAYDNLSPIMQGVNSLTAWAHENPALNPGATWVASWDTGTNLAAWSHNGQIVGLTISPSVYQAVPVSGDYARLFANALMFSAGASPEPVIPEPASMSLLGLGLLGLLGLGKKKRA